MDEAGLLRLYAETLDLLQARFCATRTREILRSLQAFRDAKRILEVGCGVGSQIEVLKELIAGKEYHGIDLSDDFVAEARRRFASLPGVRLEAQDVLSFAPERAYDLVLSWAVLQHLPDTDAALKKYAGFLRHGGVLAIFDSNDQADEFLSEPDIPTLRELYRSLSEERTGGRRKSHCLRRVREHAPALALQAVLEERGDHEAATPETRDLFVRYASRVADLVAVKYGARVDRPRLGAELERWRSDPKGRLALTGGSWLVLQKA